MSAPRPLPWWTQDWLTDQAVRLMTAAERGGYFDLLNHCWESADGCIPTDEREMRILAGMTVKEWRRGRSRILDRFTTDGCKSGKCTQSKLYQLWLEDQAFRAKCSESGKIGNQKRWGTRQEPESGLHREVIASSSSSSSSSIEEPRACDPTTTENRVRTTKPSTRTKQQSCDALTIPTEAWELAQLHRDLLLEHDPNSSVGGAAWSKKRWATDYAGAPELVNGDFSTIKSVLEWVFRVSEAWRNGGSWRDQVLKPRDLIRHWDKLRKQMGARATETSEDDQAAKRERIAFYRDYGIPESEWDPEDRPKQPAEASR